jgi:hypothetical protein
VDEPIHLINMSVANRDEGINDAVRGLRAWVLRAGDPRKLADLDDNMYSRTVTFADGSPVPAADRAKPRGILGRLRGQSPGGAHFFDIAEHRGRKYKLTPALEAWFKNFDEVVKAAREMIVEEGVKDPEFIDIMPKGDIDYFPRIWTMFNDIRMNSMPGGGKPLLGKKQSYEYSRSHQYASDALEHKFWTNYGDPMKAIDTLFKGMYTSVADKHLGDLIKPFGRNLADRVSPRLLKAQNFAKANVTALKEINQFIGKVRHAKGPAYKVTRRLKRGQLATTPISESGLGASIPVQSLLNVAAGNLYSVTQNARGKFFTLRPDGTVAPTSRKGFRNEDSAWRAASNDLFKSVRDQDDWVPSDIRRLIDEVTNKQFLRSKWRGRKTSYAYAAELAQRADEASFLRGKERSDAFNALNKDVRAAAKEANLRVSNINRAVKKAQTLKGYGGEMQFPGTSLSNKVYTPLELIKTLEEAYPERAVASPDMFTGGGKVFTNDQLQKLSSQLMGRPDRNLYTSSAAQISSALRTMQAALDLGAPLIHGLPLLFTDPERWADSVALSMRAFAGDRTVMARVITDHWDTVQKLSKHGQLGGAGSEYIEALQRGGLINKFFGAASRAGTEGGLAGITGPSAGVVRAIGRGGETTIGRFETQFDSFLLAAKIHMWEAMEPVATAAARTRGLSFVPEDELALQVARLTGSMNMNSLGMSPTLQQAAGGFLLFAPRYRLATYGLMADIASGSVRGDIARSALGKMAVGGLLMYLATGYALNQTPNLDPRKGSFLTYEIAGQNIGIGSAWVSTARFLANASSQAITEPDQLIKAWQGDSKLNKFIRGQISPVTSTGWDMIEGRNFMGEPVMDNFPNFLKGIVAQSLLPFWASSMLDTPKPGWGGVFGAVPEFGGLRSYPMSQWKSAMYTANTVALQEGDVSYEDMSVRERMVFKAKHPDVAQQIDAASAYMGERGTELQMRTTDYFKIIEDYINTDYMQGNDVLPGLQTLLAHLEKAQNSAPDLHENYDTVKKIRHALDRLGQRYASFYFEHNKDYPDVLLNLDIKKLENLPDMPTEDVAYLDFRASVLGRSFDILDKDGNEIGFDFEARREAEDLFIQRWGQSIYQLVQERRWMSKETPGVIMEWELGKKKLLSAFFGVSDLIMEREGWEHLKQDYRLYMDQSTQEQKAHFEPGVLKVLNQVNSASTKARQLLRERNPEWDAWLYRWDYYDSLVHPENIGDGSAETLALVKRTPVWLR